MAVVKPEIKSNTKKYTIIKIMSFGTRRRAVSWIGKSLCEQRTTAILTVEAFLPNFGT
jgi:hypothetical protein